MSNMTEVTHGDLPEQLYGVLAELLNRKSNVEVINSIRGEYGVLGFLCGCEEGATASELCGKLHVVPGRMADILKRLEQKKLIFRTRAEDDRRVVKVFATEAGRQMSIEKRREIREDHEGLFEILSEAEVRELIRLLKIMLSYYPDK